MNEVEKMYRTAKVVPSHHYCNDCQYNMSAECPIRCPDNVAVYPPFTTEKQIKLIKWIFNSICLLNLGRLQFSDNFENDLAGLINELWLDMTNKEKQQIKEILK